MAFFEKVISTLGLAETRAGNPIDNPATPINSPAVWEWLYDGIATESGETINEKNALQISTVYACVRVISGAIASMPLKLYEYLDNGKQEAVDAPLYYLLTVKPNPDQNAFAFIEALVISMLLHGNGFSQVERNPIGQPVALWPLNPLRTKPVRLQDGTLAYKTHDGMADGQSRIVDADDMLHMPVCAWPGSIEGLSPIGLMRQSLGLTKAAEKFGARFFGNGSCVKRSVRHPLAG